MKSSNKILSKTTFFNFRLSQPEMARIKNATLQLGYVSLAEFIRTSVREKIQRELRK